MSSSNQRQIKNMIEKGGLSGFDLARIVMSLIYELERVSEPELYDLRVPDLDRHFKEMVVFTPEEIVELKHRILKGNNEKIQEYNNWIGAFSSFISIMHCAHVNYLQIKLLLFSLGGTLDLFIAKNDASIMPVNFCFNQRNFKIKNSSHNRTESHFKDKFYNSPVDTITSIILNIQHQLSYFLYRQSLLKKVTEKIGVNFSEQIDIWYCEIVNSLKGYEDFLKNSNTISNKERQSLVHILNIINLKEMQMPIELEEKLKESLSKPIDRNKWLLQCRRYFLDERVKSL